MADTVDRKTRSRYMAAVKSTGNLSTEGRVVGILRRAGLSGWRRHLRLPGTPDFCWPKAGLAVFIDGCFWHGCPRCYNSPKSHVAYWRGKVAANRRRDLKVDSALRRAGWSVIRIWECRLDQTKVIPRIRAKLGARCCGAGVYDGTRPQRKTQRPCSRV
jgi:DNA mismatch endonuclease (patch repair protein)